MFTARGIILLGIFAYVCCQRPTEEEMKSTSKLNILEIRQVMRPDNRNAKDHNIKVILAPHSPFSNIVVWKLFLLKTDEETVEYSTEGDGKNPTSQTELIFEGNLVETDFVTVVARNDTHAVATATMALSLTDLKADVAWVGDFKTGKASSLRVDPGHLVGEVMVDGNKCSYSNSPCYYITPKPQPTSFERCYNPLPEIKQCDDREISYNEPSSLPAVFLKNEKFLEVEVPFTGQLPMMEVIAYDPLDHTKIYSNHPYKCLFPIGAQWNEGDKIRCGVSLTLPNANMTNMMVLVVKFDTDGDVIESSLQVHGDYDPNPPSGNTGVIVGAVFGTLIGLAIIVFLIVCLIKRKDEKRAKTDRGGSAVYRTTTTTDPAEA